MRMLRAPTVWPDWCSLRSSVRVGRRQAQGLALGPFRMLPSLELALEYDDNIS